MRCWRTGHGFADEYGITTDGGQITLEYRCCACFSVSNISAQLLISKSVCYLLPAPHPSSHTPFMHPLYPIKPNC